MHGIYFVGMLFAALASGQTLTPAWVELGEGIPPQNSGQSAALIRVVVGSPQDCPDAKVDGAPRPMALREPVPDGLRPVCELAVPAGTRSASVNGQQLKLPRKNPLRIVVIGDTGCRIKVPRVQSCNDPALWPFLQVATDAVDERPDLVLHVGDYLYREDPCPENSQAMCGGTPNGDNWAAWNADFFTPAAKLLATVPWAFSRGNHEDCKRSWRGWFYYLDPRPLAKNWAESCETYSRPYLVRMGRFELAMLDSAPVNEDQAEEKQVAEYARQLSSIGASLRGKHAWLADHHPFWGMKAGSESNGPVGISAPLQEAWDRASVKNIDLFLAGHVHLFELLSFDQRRPPQIVAGEGGTDLAAPIQSSVNGIPVHGTKVMAGESQHEFGYTILERTSPRDHNWRLILKDRLRQPLLNCTIAKNDALCQPKP